MQVTGGKALVGTKGGVARKEPWAGAPEPDQLCPQGRIPAPQFIRKEEDKA